MNNEWFNEIIGQVQEEMERLKELSTACEKQEVYYKTMISTHEVTIGQQAIYIGEFEKARIDSETKAHNQYDRVAIAHNSLNQEAELNAIVDEQVLEIKNLHMDVKELQETVDELWGRILGDSESYLTDDSLIHQYSSQSLGSTGVIEASDNPFPGDTTQVKKLDEIPRLVSQLTEAQEVVSGNVNTILHLQEQLKEMDEYAQEGWDLAETNSLEIKNLWTDIHSLEINGGDSDMWDTKASGRGMVEYPFNPEGETLDTSVDVSAIYREKYPSAFKPATEDTLFPGNTTPEPHPHTNPIREVPMSGRVKVKN